MPPPTAVTATTASRINSTIRTACTRHLLPSTLAAHIPGRKSTKPSSGGDARLIAAIAPELTASTAGQEGGSASAPSVTVRLAAHFSVTATVLAIIVSVGGALIAGSLGARRAARLQPADAFIQVT